MKSLSEAPIGSVVYEEVELHEAMVVGHQIHLNGCHRLVLQEQRLKDGEPLKKTTADIQECRLVRREESGVVAESADDVIGLKVQDKASGYVGRITIVQTNAGGDRDFVLRSGGKKPSGEPIDGIWVPEAMVWFLDEKREKAPAARAGTGASHEPARAVSPM